MEVLVTLGSGDTLFDTSWTLFQLRLFFSLVVFTVGSGRGEQGSLDDLVHSIDQGKLHTLVNLQWNFSEVLLVLGRKNHMRNVGLLCCEHLFFQTTDPQHTSEQCHFTGHR